MKTLYALSQELKKTIFNFGFIACILITTALFFTTGIYADSSGKTYSVFQVIFTLDHSVIKSDFTFAAINVFRNSIAGYFIMFVPIIAAFPFIPNFCSERNSGMIRFVIERTGKFRYYITKFISALLGGGLAILAGYILYGVIIALIFPHLSAYTIPTEMKDMYSTTGVVLTILKCLLGVFIYGMVSAAPAFLIASFAKNRYIITCVPFMIVYLYNTSLNKISYDAIENSNQRLSGFAFSLRTDMVTYLMNFNKNVRNSLIINIIFVFVSFLSFMIIMNRRWDSGE